GDAEGERDAGGAGGCGGAATAARGSRRGAAAGDGHQPRARRSFPLRELLGGGRAAAVRRQRPVRAEIRRLGAHRGNRSSDVAPEGRGSTAERCAADGGDQARRSARVHHQLAVLAVGRAVLPGWHPWLDGEARREARRRDRVRQGIPRRVRGRTGAAPGTPGGRGRVVRFLLLLGVTMRDASFPWLSLLLLGAVHGINPAMGWLFAVARGLQERDQRAIWRALGPLAVGHACAIAAAIVFVATVGRVAPLGFMRWMVAAILVLVGIDGLRRHRHVQLKGMRVSAREVGTWSFLMASAHGAGVVVLTLILGVAGPMPAGMR